MTPPGGRIDKVDWAAFLLPFGRSRRKVFTCIFWVVVPILMGVMLHRWYLGLTWFSLAPFSWDAWVMAGGAGGALLLFAFWLRWEYARRPRV